MNEPGETMTDETPLERLEALSTEIETVATQVALRAKAFGGEAGAGNRVALVQQRLRIALDELAGYPGSAGDITEE